MSDTGQFSKVFKRLRLERGIAQADFEGVATARYIRKLEKGLATPTLQMMSSLAGELGLSPVVLLALTLAEAEHGTDVDILRNTAGELERLLASIQQTNGSPA